MLNSKIEWCDYTINPIKGICKMGCEYCYALTMYKRFKWDPEIRFDSSAFNGLEKIKIVKSGGYISPKIFVCSTHDMFGYWIPDNWIQAIIQKAETNPQLTFIFLTKSPQNAWHWAYPKNVWLGVTVESQEQTWRIKTLLQPEIRASLKFVSFEPLQGEIHCDFSNHRLGDDNQRISWFIIGTETGNRKDKVLTRHDWVTKLLYENPDTPAFLKNNLRYCLQGCNLYQEFPKDAQTSIKEV